MGVAVFLGDGITAMISAVTSAIRLFPDLSVKGCTCTISSRGSWPGREASSSRPWNGQRVSILTEKVRDAVMRRVLKLILTAINFTSRVSALVWKDWGGMNSC